MDEFSPVTNWGDWRSGAEGAKREEEIYLGLCWRWRNLLKPTIAEVQGKAVRWSDVIWVCDLIVATSETTFSDPVVAFGVNGVEYFAHPWEFGPRKAKELLFTGGRMTAQEAQSCGMVNHVVANEELSEFTDQLAARIAQRPSMGLRLAKQSVNQAQDAQGFYSALQAAMSRNSLATRIMKSFMAELLTSRGCGYQARGKIILLSTQPRRKLYWALAPVSWLFFLRNALRPSAKSSL